jgi:hypothetical protein
MGQQDLRGFQAVVEEGGLVGLRQAHLAHGGGGLQLMHGVGPRCPAQALHAGGDGAGGDQQHLAALVVQRGDLARAVGDEAWSRPWPLLVTSALPTLTTRRFASAICLLMLPSIAVRDDPSRHSSHARQPSPEMAEITKCFFGL